MEFLQQIANRLDGYNQLKKSCNDKGAYKLTGLSSVHKAHIIHSLCADKQHRAFVVMPDEASVRRMYNDLASMGTNVIELPYKDLNLRDFEGSSREYEYKRLDTFYKIINKQYTVLLSTIDSCLEYTIPKNTLIENIIQLDLGKTLDIKDFLKHLANIGYVSSAMVEGKGQFSLRGDIIDIFPPNHELPIRIELFGDEIDSINYFDIDTQRRKDKLKSIVILPISEIIIENKEENKYINPSVRCLDRYINLAYSNPATLLDYITDDIVFLCEFENAKQIFNSNQKEIKVTINDLIADKSIKKSDSKFFATIDDFNNKLNSCFVAFLDNFAVNHNIKLAGISNINCATLPLWNGSIKNLESIINEAMYKKGCSCIVLGGSKVFTKNTFVALQDSNNNNFELIYNNDFFKADTVSVIEGTLSGSFSYPDINTQIISHGYVESSKLKKKIKNKTTKGKSITSLDELELGDYVVHSSHGIGKFNGIQTIKMQNIVKDYMKIMYAKDDVLYVPVTQLDMVAKYVGARNNVGIKLNKLGTQEWNNTKKKAKSQAKDIARDLIKIYSERLHSKGYAFPEDTEWQHDFENNFPFEETDAQLRCIDEIKEDMEKEYPMDRLLCGDVGFGKTEVALRAAFKCVSSGKQCAILVPTTILAWQHYNNIKERFKEFPIEIEMISRFRTAKEQKEILKRLEKGEIDILIGTHRIVQNDIKFRDLGLIIIDEEQRFGVLQKEKLKKIANNADILTMSATPIPRTLNMAISGIRDMSSLEEPPQDRYPVQTYVLEYDKNVINEAIEKELKRGGQVYFLHNRIDSISSVAYRLQNEIPNAKVGIGHSKMTEEELSEVWRQLIDGEINILVCTTIIESGIDVPNVNTLIVDNADCMGLSQLYQLRGRVGRSTRRAYAYLTFKKDKALSEIAMKRLNAIRDFTEFGSGFKISMRDLELRGAGNILGGEQHGHMDAVGYDMYIKLLSDAVAEEKGIEKIEEKIDCLIDIEMQAHIPENYISDLNQRLSIYRRIADITDDDDANDVKAELLDRFGDIPSSVIDLIDVALVRNLASKLCIYEIKQNKNLLLFKIDNPDMSKISTLVGVMGRRVMFNALAKPYVSVKIDSNVKVLSLVKDVLEVLNS